MDLNSVQELVEDIRLGKMVILMDDEDRENEGDLVVAASMVTAEHINFMAKNARGLICLTLTRERCEFLRLPLMVHNNNAQFSTNFTVSIEAAEGVTTGISAADRAVTVQRAVSADSRPEDIVMPGHIFPLMAKPGGVLSRAGHTEAGCDLASMAGFVPAAVIIEIMNDDGTMARRPDLEKFAKLHDIKIGTIADLIHYRMMNEKTVERKDVREIQTDLGTFSLYTYQDNAQGHAHLALTMGTWDKSDAVPVRVQLCDPVRDMLAITNDEGPHWTVKKAMQVVADAGHGVVVLLADPAMNQNLAERATTLFNDKHTPLPQTKDGTHVYATIGTGSQILRDLGVCNMKLMSAPMKFSALSGFDLHVVEYIDCK